MDGTNDAGAPRHVLMTADTLGGVWTYALELARGLKAYGTKISLATMGQRLSPIQWRNVAEISNLEVFESDFKLEWMKDPWPDVWQAGGWLLTLADRLEPDLIHLNGYVHASLPWRAPKVVVGHSCVTSWWSAVKGSALPSRWDYYQQQVRRGLREADVVLAPTAGMLRSLRRHYGSMRRRHVISNSRDPALFESAAKKPFVLAVGRLWDEAKNLATLERAAPRLPWPVYVAGESRHPNGNRVWPHDVIPLGHLGPVELGHWFGRAAIYALPARYEPFGLTALEAALSECALVLGNIPTLREVWNDAAIFVDPDDDEALVRAIRALIDDHSYREAMGARARRRAELYAPSRMADGYVTAYREALVTASGRDDRIYPSAAVGSNGGASAGAN